MKPKTRSLHLSECMQLDLDPIIYCAVLCEVCERVVDYVSVENIEDGVYYCDRPVLCSDHMSDVWDYERGVPR